MSSLVATPHLRFPFSFSAENGATVLEQDSFDEIISSVQMVLACPLGACPDLPTYGYPDLTFEPGPPSTSALLAAIQLWEPRATEAAVVTALAETQGTWSVQITPTVIGT